METLLTAYLVIFLLGAVINLAMGFRESVKFQRYMEEHHPREWEALVYDEFLKKVLWPFGRKTLVGFIWKSTETMGDPKISLFRRKLRWAFYGWVLYAVGGFLGFVFLAVVIHLFRL